jgi:uncharacterized protein DUF6894
MPRFFFSLHLGEQCLPDPDGVVLANAAEAKQEASLIARDLLGTRRPKGTWSGWSISVREAAGEALLELSLIEAALLGSDSDLDRSNVIVLPQARLPQRYTPSAIRKLHNDVHDRLLSLSVLKDQNRYVRAMLLHEMHAGREIIQHARQVLERSRTQTHAFV